MIIVGNHRFSIRFFFKNIKNQKNKGLILSGWLVAIGPLFSLKHCHRGKSSFFHQIIFRKNKKSFKGNLILLGCGVLGCCSQGGSRDVLLGGVWGPGAEELSSIGTIISVFGEGAGSVVIQCPEMGDVRSGRVGSCRPVSAADC